MVRCEWAKTEPNITYLDFDMSAQTCDGAFCKYFGAIG